VTINDGASHPVDSSDIAFQLAAIGAFREAYEKAKPVILEPIMKVEVEGPTEFQGNFFASINQRRGMISSSSENGAFCKVEAEVPLSEMFGYSTVIRSLSPGQGRVHDGVPEVRQGPHERPQGFRAAPQGLPGEAKGRTEPLDNRGESTSFHVLPCAGIWVYTDV
jgi:hypothetical protein